MDRDTLEKRKAEIDARYKELGNEMKRLEGEYRLLEELLNTENTQPEIPQPTKRIRKVVADAPTE